MPSTELPYEIKRIIFGHLDLDDLKALRLASKSWSTVGIEVLFLPTFIVRTSAVDISALLQIGQNSKLSEQAAKTIETIEFTSIDEDLRYMRRIVCDRHIQRMQWEEMAFVPTMEEQEALEELNERACLRELDQQFDKNHPLNLVEALRCTPGLKGLNFTYGNPFKGKLLRKVWDEYDQDTRTPAQVYQGLGRFIITLRAAKAAGLTIVTLYHAQLSPVFFLLGHETVTDSDITPYISTLTSLTLTINSAAFTNSNDPNAFFAVGSDTRFRLQQVLSACSNLKLLCLTFQGSEQLDTGFLPLLPYTKLHSLHLSGITPTTSELLSVISAYAPTLRRLSISSHTITVQGEWKTFFEQLRDMPDLKLEEVQFTGFFGDVSGIAMLLIPLYDDDWSPAVMPERLHGRDVQRWTRELEAFLIRDGTWPWDGHQVSTNDGAG